MHLYVEPKPGTGSPLCQAVEPYMSLRELLAESRHVTVVPSMVTCQRCREEMERREAAK